MFCDIKDVKPIKSSFDVYIVCCIFKQINFEYTWKILFIKAKINKSDGQTLNN